MDPQFGYERLAISVPREALIGAKNARADIAGRVHDGAQRGRARFTDVALRDAINAGDVPGPRMLVSGPALSITGGHCDNNMLPFEYHAVGDGVADGIAAVQHKVRENIKYGADVIKVCATGGVLSLGDNPQHSQYTLEEMKAIVADAHRLGRKVAAHAHGAEGIRWAAEAGVDSIEHGSYIDDAGIAAMKEHGTYLVPTLYLGDWMIDNAGLTHLPPPLLAKAQEVIPAARKNIAHAFASGVKVAFGTDAAVYPHGMNAHEFAVMVRLGLTPLQAIQAATMNAADLLGWSGKVGTPGAGGVGGHRRGGWRSGEGCHDAGAREVRDEGRRSGEERVREVKSMVLLSIFVRSRVARRYDAVPTVLCSVTQSVQNAEAPLESSGALPSTASTKVLDHGIVQVGVRREDSRGLPDKRVRGRSAATFPSRLRCRGCGIRRGLTFECQRTSTTPRTPSVVFDHHGGVVFDGVVMHHVRELGGDAQRLAEKKIQNIDAVRGDVEERSASGLGGIDQPTAAAGSVKPHVVGQFGEHGLADRACCEQLFGALHFGIAAAIVGDAERLAAFICGLNHGAGLGLVHGHRLFAEHVLAGAERLNRLRRVQKDWRADVDGMDFADRRELRRESARRVLRKERLSRDRG